MDCGQLPTLAMLVEHEVKIINFKNEKYFMVHILCDGDVVKGKYGTYCKNKCGMNVSKEIKGSQYKVKLDFTKKK